MIRARAISILKSIRCIDCHREPTQAEVEEMYTVFGHKMDDSDSEKTLIWQCLSCCKIELN